jgi:hypothetical protein
MENAYDSIPFFYMKAELAVNLNIGGILSKFGGDPVAAALLSALGGEANLHVDAAHELRWSTPVCADSVDDRSKQSKNHYRAFDNDFMKNVFLPMCKTYQRDSDPNVKCWIDGEGGTSTLLQRTADLSSRPLLAAEACVRTEAPWFESNTFKVDFVAPAKWGFAPGQDAYLYQRNASVSDVWKRCDDVQIIGVDGQKCGRRDLKDGEVCVHAKVKHAFFEDECSQIQNTGSRMFGVSQIDAEDTARTLQYKLP